MPKSNQIQAWTLLLTASIMFGLWQHSWFAGIFLISIFLVSFQVLHEIINY